MERLTSKSKRLFLNSHLKDVVEFLLPWGQIACFACPRPNDQERKNEDSLGFKSLTRNSGVLAVADGLGGHTHGDLASEAVIKKICSAVTRREGRRDYTLSEIMQKVESAQTQIRKIHRDSGSTLVAAYLSNKHLRFFSVGDSSAMLFDRKGQLIYRTVEHSVTGYGMESGLLDEKSALNHSQSHVILNALGADPLHVEVSLPIRLRKGYQVLMSSDGLTGNLKLSVIQQILNSGSSKEKIFQLKEAALKQMQAEQGSPDDLSLLHFQMT